MFELVIAVDWSAASVQGPKRETKDRCWLAWSRQGTRSLPEYFRNRAACIERIADPSGSGMGGGRAAAAKITALLTSNEDDSNNRFDVAKQLNSDFFSDPGPFWGCPKNQSDAHLPTNKPAYFHHPFEEWRIVENYLRVEKKQSTISPVWKLAYPGSVGSQTLTGLKALYDLASLPEFSSRARFWPFDTGWEADLEGIILTEIWPSLNDHDRYEHPIKDARQVLACRDWFLNSENTGASEQLFKAPDWLTANEREKCFKEEGWILGVS
jgi:hypothetical protein